MKIIKFQKMFDFLVNKEYNRRKNMFESTTSYGLECMYRESELMAYDEVCNKMYRYRNLLESKFSKVKRYGNIKDLHDIFYC